MSSLRKLLLPAALTLILAACGKEEAPAPATPTAAAVVAAPVVSNAATPVAAMQSVAKAFQANDVNAMLKAAVPPAAYNEIKTKFEAEMASKTVTPEENAEFQANLAKLTGPTAIDDLMTMIEPQLEAIKPQLSGYVTMGIAGIQMSINNPENKDLTDAQKAQAGAVINGLQGWAMKTDFADASKVRAALTDVSNAVKATGITSLEQVKALNFEEAMGKVSILLAGLKKALGNYGLDLDAIIASQKVELVSETGDTAKVKTSITVFDVPVESESELVKIDGNWYAKDSVEAIKKAMTQ